MKTRYGARSTRRCWISPQFPLDIFTGLLGRHLETFRKLEEIQKQALAGMQNQGMEGLAALMARQTEVLQAIGREKAELRPYLDQWEQLPADVRGAHRQGEAGRILDALETVAQGIQARHQEMFGEDPGAAKPAQGKPGAGADDAPPQDLSQTINLYRGLH